MPPGVAPALRRLERVAELRQTYLRRRLFEALETMATARIPVVLLKGAALACTNHGSFSERPMGDLDLLIEPGRAAEAHDVLCRSGWARRYGPEWDFMYSEMHHLPPLADTRAPKLAVTVELHTELFPPQLSSFSFSARQIWEGAHPLPGLPGGAKVPSPLHRLLHCCLHFAWSNMLRSSAWKTFRDVAVLCDQGVVDWKEFVEVAGDSGGGTCCYWTLRLAQRLASADVPDEVLEPLRAALPAPLLKLLEHHFVRASLKGEARYSLRLRRLLWAAAVQPARSGHGRRRPWAHDARPWHLLKNRPDERSVSLPGMPAA
jgi:hypothetical protein